jgi:predicted nucleotidyltransferase
MEDAYIAHFKKREKEKARQRKKAARQTLQEVREKVPALTGYFPEIKKIILFGSLAEGRFSRNSDIDIYIEGLKPENYYKALHKLEDFLRKEVELYTDTDSRDFIEKIKARGIVLYEN